MIDLQASARRIIELDSSPGTGSLEIARHFAGLASGLGLQAELQEASLNGVAQANVIIRPAGPRPADEILLQTHLDTVEPGPFPLWTDTGSNPFSMSIYRDVFVGLGVADTKLDFLCKLMAVDALRGRSWRTPPVLVGTYGEELGMAGALKLIRQKKISARTALVGEPTGLRLVTAGKGYIAVEIEVPFTAAERRYRSEHDVQESVSTQSKLFFGRAAHSSRPADGDNAVNRALDFLSRLPSGLVLMNLEGGNNANTVPAVASVEFDAIGGAEKGVIEKIARIRRATQDMEAQFSGFSDTRFDPPQPTLNLGLVRTYDDHVRLSGCCRTTPTVTDRVFEEWMAQMDGVCREVGGVFRVTDYKRPFSSSQSSAWQDICLEAAGEAGISQSLEAQSVANEANLFARFGIDCIVFGPGQGVGNSHAPNERVAVADLQRAIVYYTAVLSRMVI